MDFRLSGNNRNTESALRGDELWFWISLHMYVQYLNIRLSSHQGEVSLKLYTFSPPNLPIGFADLFFFSVKALQIVLYILQQAYQIGGEKNGRSLSIFVAA